MGGSGSGRLGNLKRLEKVAKEALERKRRNIFISFSSEDLNEVNLLRAQAKNENSDMEFVDRSLQSPFNSTRAEYIRNRLEARINQASMTVVFLSDHTPSSKWVDWEVRKSLDLGKDVIAVHSGSTRPRNLPSSISENNIKVVPWSKLPDEII